MPGISPSFLSRGTIRATGYFELDNDNEPVSVVDFQLCVRARWRATARTDEPLTPVTPLWTVSL